MHLVIGGRAQGKRRFAAEQFNPGITFCDGHKESWERIKQEKYIFNLHLMIRQRMVQGLLTEGMEQAFAAELLAENEDKVIVTDEIGCGIVPADAFERDYREMTGRICCLLAQRAVSVWRVIGGIGIKIK